MTDDEIEAGRERIAEAFAEGREWLAEELGGEPGDYNYDIDLDAGTARDPETGDLIDLTTGTDAEAASDD